MERGIVVAFDFEYAYGPVAVKRVASAADRGIFVQLSSSGECDDQEIIIVFQSWSLWL